MALVAFSYQQKRKTFISVREVNALEPPVPDTLDYVTDAYNKESEDVYNFRILRILKIEKRVSMWLPCLSSTENPSALVKSSVLFCFCFFYIRSHYTD